ncbi:ubiquitin-protein ligase E3B [Aplysia californica]|uniref:HECT-type E3 ubiquitin transferase n=1 Tax=Aplysia californica TaxID=6500 RepID=A0ABM1W4A0_APLCA|nr:ubiquitin-protein ligase E3B [Aplysia californica]XP_035829493.1 ubiquitin-protein ligase E3B [Aplysia californica]
MFSKVGSDKNKFLEQAKAARLERAQDRNREEAAVKLQAGIRGFLTRQRVKRTFREEVDSFLQIPPPDTEYKPTLKPAIETFHVVKKLHFVHDVHSEGDQKRFEFMCRYILASMDTDSLKNCYVAVSFNKNLTLLWIAQLKTVLWTCCQYFYSLRPENHKDLRTIMVFLRMLVTFTAHNNWVAFKDKEALHPGFTKLCDNVMGDLNSRGLYTALEALLRKGLCRSKPAFNKASLTAIITISLRPLLSANFSNNLLSIFLLHILSVPAVVYYINTIAQDCVATLVTHRVFKRCLDLLTIEQSTRIIFNSLEGNYALCLMANLVQLGYVEMEGLVENTVDFMTVMIRLLENCNKYVQNKKSNLTHWHPVLGWFSQKTDQSLHESMPLVVRQLQLLWSDRMIRLMFAVLLEYTETSPVPDSQSVSSKKNNILKKALIKASSNKLSSSQRIKLDSGIAFSTCLPCSLYRHAVTTLTQLSMDILGGLAYNNVLLPILWRFLCDLGPHCGLKTFIDLLSQAPGSTIHPVFSLLSLFCETASHMITTLDVIEMLEQQKVFKVADYVKMGEFLNLFVFRVIWGGLISIEQAPTSNVFTSALNLLMILHERDSRRSFAPTNHWLIREVKPSHFMDELEKEKKTAKFLMQRVPHIIPFNERVIIFRKNVLRDKENLRLLESAHTSVQSTLITVHRIRIVEDGYRQLAQLPSRALKGVIRVRFINMMGLEEAGIDQDGVFKEFLEETIKRVFDPHLNLFKVTSEQKLYPSSTSYLQESHLALFEFIGKMLAKAVYEGIVVDVPFAPFFLTQILGHLQSATYSSLDELPSLDMELAKSLSYIKHYDGDVSDLELTYSCDEDILGQVVTHELVPGGKAIQVTDENKIRYVHLMAHFHMYRQIREQTLAFVRGFESVVTPEWLGMFSAPELQKLISGDSESLDMEDLRHHTRYHGGYHNNHKVINWLWDVVDNDLNLEEKGLFLKFVTSCSKPPLMGFAHMEPPFSIRCVEVSDDQDTGDTVGSVLKGFFNIKKKDSVWLLPTSSTCFNLLKLPNYPKKSILRDKLRYAIHSNSGFENS